MFNFIRLRICKLYCSWYSTFKQIEEVFYYLNNTILSESDYKEINAAEQFEKSRTGQSIDDTFDAVVFRSPSIRIFQKLISKLQLSGNETILEMGGGFCWASTLIKRKYPNTYVVGSDLIFFNLKFTRKFEKILDANLDEKWAFNCKEIPFESEQFDRIFVFAAFHHFGEQNNFNQTLAEMIRVLKPKGKIVLLYEPSSPTYLYQSAYKRVNIDPYADEDLLILSKIKQAVNSLNCKFSFEFYTSYEDRGLLQSIYYFILTKIRILQKLLPCTVNIFIDKS
jgi:ubiquinone/menaquinone biosynthesis C-methylase UbiE